MKPVDPYDVVTLALDTSWQPYHVLTARAAFHHTLNQSVKPVDVAGIQFDRDDWFKGHQEQDDENRVYVAYGENHPVLRSAHLEWPVPTVVVVTDSFFHNAVKPRNPRNGKKTITAKFKRKGSRRRKMPSRIEMCRHFKFKCQYCWKKFPYEQLNIDHKFPKDKGGSNDRDNLTLSCIKCNSRKSNHHPWPDVHGNEPKGMRERPNFFYISDEEMRPEWEKHLWT